MDDARGEFSLDPREIASDRGDAASQAPAGTAPWQSMNSVAHATGKIRWIKLPC